MTWVRWARGTFPGVQMDFKTWSTMTGMQLVSMTQAEFQSHAKNDQNNMFWLHFDRMKTTQLAEIPKLVKSNVSEEKTKPKVVLGKYTQGNVIMNLDEGSIGNRTGNNGMNIQLWKFVLELLTDYQYRYVC